MRTGAFVIFSSRFVKSFRFFSAPSVVAILIFLVSCSPSEGRGRSLYGCHDDTLACLRKVFSLWKISHVLGKDVY